VETGISVSSAECEREMIEFLIK